MFDRKRSELRVLCQVPAEVISHNRSATTVAWRTVGGTRDVQHSSQSATYPQASGEVSGGATALGQTVPVRVHVCGVRGSTPSPGEDFVRYGGHTSCIAVARDGEAPSLVLDAGTGIRRVSELLGAEAFSGSLLLGHLHWDHTQGIPFFRAGDAEGSRVDLYAPAQGDTETVLERFMSPPHFPITPSELRGAWRFEALEPGKVTLEGFSIVALEVPHKGGRTFGYRISDGRSTVAYMSDHCPTALGAGPDGLGEYHEAALELVEGCDVVFHDAQYTDDELPRMASFGHSSAGYAVRLAEHAGAGRLFLFHHDPWRTDVQVDEIVARYSGAPLEVRGAAERTVIDL